jgi:peptide chain release factor subunit 1
MTALKNKIVAVKDVSYTDETGLKELVENSMETLAKEEITIEKELLTKFFTLLATKPEKIAYGEDEVKRALTLGAVDKLYISKTLEKYKIDELRRMAADTGTGVFFISVETNEGMQFKNIGGMGAILRYQID